MKLRNALFIAFTAVAILPIAVFGFWLREEAVEQQLRLVEEKHLLVAENMTAALERYVKDVEATFDLTVNTALNNALDKGSLAELLRDMHFQHVCLIDSEYRLLAFQPGLQLTAPKAIPKKMMAPLWQSASFEPQFSPVDNVSGALGIWVYKRTSAGNLAVGRIATDYIVGMQQQISFGDGGHAAVVDASGNVIAHPRIDWMRAVKNIAKVDAVQRMMAGESGISYFYSPAAKVDMVAGFSSVPKTGWGVMVPQPLQEIQQGANQITQGVLLVTAIATAFAILLGWVLANWLTQPISWLHQRVQNISDGNYIDTGIRFEHRSAATEFSDLIAGFDLMRSRLRASEHDLKSQNGIFAVTLDALQEGVALVDSNDIVQFHNDRFVSMLELPDRQLVSNSTFGELIDLLGDNVKLVTDPAAGTALKLSRKILTREIFERKEKQVSRGLILRLNSGKHYELSIAPAPDNRKLYVLSDISEQREQSQTLRFMATHDELTGLLNRSEFLDKLSSQLALAQQVNQQLAVAYIDMHRFKEVNDSLGHAFGDQLLQLVAKRIEEFPAVVAAARLGGDEFAVYFGEFEQSAQAMNEAKQLVDLLQRPYDLNGQLVKLNASTGVSIWPSDAQDAEGLLQAADLAMYSLKRRNSNSLQRYTASMSDGLKQRQALEAALVQAVDAAEFDVHYQPIIAVDSGAVTAVECLLRWNRAEQYSVDIIQIIEVCEQVGLIHQVSKQVFAKALKELAPLKASNGASLAVSLNLSGSEFTRPALIEQLSEIVKESGVAPERVEVELTECKSVLDTDSIRVSMEALRTQGVKIALDNFGSGCSSFRHLSELPIDTVKIYSGMMEAVPDAENTNKTVIGILGLARRLGVKAIATGVETEAQRALVTGAGCDALQGRLIAAPMSAAELRDFLESFPAEAI